MCHCCGMSLMPFTNSKKFIPRYTGCLFRYAFYVALLSGLYSARTLYGEKRL